MNRRGALIFFFTLGLLGAGPARGLTDEEVFRELRFNLINPGARSLSLGGAFISLADDATAAQANPAGLSFLTQMEYFVELRAVDNEARSSVIEESLPAGIDTFVATGTDLEDVVSPTFVSVVTNYGGDAGMRRWSMGLSRQEVLNIENSTLSSFAFTFGENSPGAFLAEGSGSVDMSVTNVNVSVGVRVTDNLSVGGTLTYSELDAETEVVNMVVDTGPNVATGDPILEPVLDLRTSIDDTDEDVVGSVGILYKRQKQGSPRWSLGAVYRWGPSFSVVQRIDPAGLDLFGVRERDELSTAFFNRVSLPDSFGVGGSWLPIKDRLTLAFGVDRILYSNLLDGYVAGVNTLTTPSARFSIDDGTDYRAGAEYIIFNENNFLPPLAFRGGVFSESDTTIEAIQTGSEEDPGFATTDVFAGRDRETHGTIGVGINVRRLQIDLAADFSDSKNEYLISLIYRGN